jgi:hypothetical protein
LFRENFSQSVFSAHELARNSDQSHFTFYLFEKGIIFFKFLF